MSKLSHVSNDYFIVNYINSNKSASSIGKELGVHHNTVLTELKKRQISIKTVSEINSKYSKDDEYFTVPNIQNCYWAGFIAADGCVSDTLNQNPILCFGVQYTDRCILEEFKKQTRYTGKIYDRNYKFPSSVLNIYNAAIWANNLNKYWNITPRKSLTLIPPNITEMELQLAYIIGIIDGDGSVGLASSGRAGYKYLHLGITGTKELLIWITRILHGLEDKKYKIPTPRRGTGNIWQISYKNLRAKDILKQLAKITTPYKLERKWCKI